MASDALENGILNLLLRATALTIGGVNIAINAASDPATQYWLAAHTADPTDSGNQTSSECAYTGYARQAVARSSDGWSESTTGSSSNVAAVEFPTCSASPGSPITHISIGVAETGNGGILQVCALGSSYQPAIGNKPAFAAGAIVFSATQRVTAIERA